MNTLYKNWTEYSVSTTQHSQILVQYSKKLLKQNPQQFATILFISGFWNFSAFLPKKA